MFQSQPFSPWIGGVALSQDGLSPTSCHGRRKWWKQVHKYLGLCDAKMSRFNLQGRFPGNELSCGQKPNGRSRNSKLTGKRVLHAISLSNKSPANVAGRLPSVHPIGPWVCICLAEFPRGIQATELVTMSSLLKLSFEVRLILICFPGPRVNQKVILVVKLAHHNNGNSVRLSRWGSYGLSRTKW